jgi:integrase
MKALDKKMKEINAQNNNPRPSCVTLEDFESGLWQAYIASKSYKPSTTYNYQSILDRHILPSIGRKEIAKIRPEDLTMFFASVRAKGVSNKYLLNVYNVISLMFDVAAEYNLIESTPVKRKLHRPEWERGQKPSLRPEEIGKVLENVPTEHFPLFALIAITGLRLGEALAPRWMDINFDARTLSITYSLWRGRLVAPKTKASERSLHLPQALVEILRGHHERSRWREPEDFIFCREDGSPWDPDHLREQVLYPAMEAAGIKRGNGTHGFHIFRHSAGSIVYANTRDLRLAQELLRHSQIGATSDVYVHVESSVASEATDTLAKAILPNCGLTVAQISDKIQ